MPSLSDESFGAESASRGKGERVRAAETATLLPTIPDYELLRRIGRGGYGEVWLARGVTGILRAVKIVWRERFPDATPFEREFRGLKEFAAISLEESIQLALLHVGKNEAAGFFYYVMELADDAAHGRAIDPANYVPLTLAELRSRRGRLPAEECIRIGVELSRALAALHRHGLVHRDIKPSNVIFVGGMPKLADIGLVAPAAAARTFIGTEGFMPPEGPGAANADVFALGKLLYELATGRDRAEFPQLPPDVARLPDAHRLLRLNDVILRACDPEPRKRPGDAAALLRELEALQSGASMRRRVAARVAMLAAALLLASAVTWMWQAGGWRRLRPSVSAHTTAAKSIAVLPFANLSADPANASFADGVHEDVINGLNLIRDLHVVSRTSVMAYRSTTKPVAAIARELGVRYLLESTARREGGRLKITSKLIDAPLDRQVWGATYDREVTDVFAVQEQLASAIAGALAATVLPETQALLAQRPTANLAAYESFVKGRELAERPSRMLEAEPLLQAAVDLDPKFTAAWCALAMVNSQIIGSNIERTPARFAKAESALARGQQLAADAPDVIRATGIHHFLVGRDFAAAQRQFERLRAAQPNDASVWYYLGSMDWAQQRYRDGLAKHERASRLDPASQQYSRRLQYEYNALRRWREKLTEQQRISSLWPGSLASDRPWSEGLLGDQIVIAKTKAFLNGDIRPLEELLARSTPAERESPPFLAARMDIAFARRDVDEYKRLDRRLAVPPADAETILRSILVATDYFELGDAKAGLARLRDVVAAVHATAAADPENANSWVDVARVEAMLGHMEEAKAAIRRCAELLPESEVPTVGALFSRSLAVTYAWMGEKEMAVTELARLVNHPDARLSGYEMRTLSTFFPLRGHPRFEALANDPKNDAPLM